MKKTEDRRQAVHAGAALLLIALRWLTPFQAACMAGAAVVLNWVILPVTGLDRGLRREGGPWIDGVKVYPLAVLAAVLLFPLPAAAAGWAVLGIADAASNVAGRRWGRPPFLGRADRSLVGTATFIAAGTPAAVLAWCWVAQVAPTGPVILAGALAAFAGAALEMLTPRWLDDNLPICLAAAAVMSL